MTTEGGTGLMADWLEKIGPEPLTQLLGELMSAASEDCYHAGWHVGTEYLVPALCERVLALGRPQPWAHGELGSGTAGVIQAIADQLGHWANLGEEPVRLTPFDPFPTPLEHLDELDHWRRKSR